MRKSVRKILQNESVQILLLYLVIFGCWVTIFLTASDSKIIVLLTIWLGLVLIIAEWYRRTGSKVGITLSSWEEYCKLREREMSAEDAWIRDCVCRQLGRNVQICRSGEDLWWVLTPYLDCHNDYIEFYIVREGNGRITAKCSIGELLTQMKAIGIPEQAIESVSHLYGTTLTNNSLFISTQTNEEFPRLHNLLMTLLTFNGWVVLYTC